MKQRRGMRFSLRFLLAMVMLLCGLLAAWNAGKERAITDLQAASGGYSPRIVAPYVLCIEKSDNVTVVATYHAWCFGLICDLPYSRRFPETGGLILGGVRPRIIDQGDEGELLGIPAD